MTVEPTLPEPAATMYELTEKLREDLAFAAPEIWALHIERRLAQAYDAGGAAALREIAEKVGKLDEMLDALTVSIDGPEPWPWHAAGLLVADEGDCSWWLDNERQTSAFPDGDDVAAMLNVILDLRAILTEATGASE